MACGINYIFKVFYNELVDIIVILGEVTSFKKQKVIEYYQTKQEKNRLMKKIK